MKFYNNQHLFCSIFLFETCFLLWLVRETSHNKNTIKERLALGKVVWVPTADFFCIVVIQIERKWSKFATPAYTDSILISHNAFSKLVTMKERVIDKHIEWWNGSSVCMWFLQEGSGQVWRVTWVSSWLWESIDVSSSTRSRTTQNICFTSVLYVALWGRQEQLF